MQSMCKVAWDIITDALEDARLRRNFIFIVYGCYWRDISAIS